MFVYYHMGPKPKRDIRWSVHYETVFLSSSRWKLPTGVQGVELKTVLEYLTRAMTVTETLRRAAASGRELPVDAHGYFDTSAYERIVALLAHEDGRQATGWTSDSMNEYSTDEEMLLGTDRNAESRAGVGMHVGGTASGTSGRYRPYVQLGSRFEPKAPLSLAPSRWGGVALGRDMGTRLSLVHGLHTVGGISNRGGNSAGLAGVSAAAAAAGLAMGTSGMPVSSVASTNPLILQAEYALSQYQYQYQHQHQHQHQHQFGANVAHVAIPRPLRKEVTLTDENVSDYSSTIAIDAISQQLIGQV